jgi:flagellar M-ring protein FliF
VTVASDLPDGEAAEGGGERTSNDSETRETTNFEVSETQREIVREPGGIRRLTVAVLVDGTREVQPDGTEVWTARPEDELADMRDLVASAVGYDAERGDEITIKSLAFEALPEGDGATGPAAPFPLDVMQLAQLGTLAAVALALGLFVVRPILTSAPAVGPGLPPPSPDADAAEAATGPALTGEIADEDFTPPALNTVADFGTGFDGPGEGNGLPALGGGEDAVSHLKGLIAERQDETLEILRGWMAEDRERA